MIAQMIEELRNTNSNPVKVSILKKYDSDFIRQVLKLAYNPQSSFGVTAYPSLRDIHNTDVIRKAEYTLLSMLQQRKLTGHAAIAAMERNLKDNGGLVNLIVSKDFKCGISVTTINKAFPKLIPVMKLQKAATQSLDRVKFPCYVETKYDGVRLGIVNRPDGVTVMTYNNKRVPLPKLESEIARLPYGVYDGELIYSNGKSNTRTSISGLVNSAIHGGNVPEAGLSFMVFDCLSIDEFEAEKCNLTYERRRDRFKLALSSYPSSYVKLTPSKFIETASEVNDIYEELIQQGFEGLILKQPKSVYSFKRSKDWIKLKEVIECDLRCIDYEEGSGKYEGAIGSLVCKGRIFGRLNNVGESSYYNIEVKVSGLTAELRHKPFEHFKDKIIEIKYNQIIQDEATGKYSLFAPRFNRIRYDK